MIQVKCNKVGHLEHSVQALCLRQDCKNSCACCMRCMQLHPDCRNHLKFFEDFPEAMMQLTTLRNWFKDSFNDIQQLIAELENIMSQHFLPIDEYTHSPTLTNLNRLGQMMKDSKSINIEVLDQQKKKICQDLDQFKGMLFDRNKSQTQQIDPVVVSLKDKDLVQKYFKAGYELYYYAQYQEAIECYDKALQIDKNHIDSLFWKGKFQIFLGCSLFCLNNYQEAIVSFDQCIKIDPQKLDSYYYKGWSLQRMNNHEEAIKCFDEKIKISSKDRYSYKAKGESLRKLSRLKEEEECYIEGLKHIPYDEELKNLLSSVQEVMKKLK